MFYLFISLLVQFFGVLKMSKVSKGTVIGKLSYMKMLYYRLLNIIVIEF